MSNQERASIVAIITNLLLNGYVIYRLSQLHSVGALSGDDALVVWARSIMWIIPAAIGLTIILNILIAILANDRDCRSVVDERDRVFQLRGMSITLFSVGVGFTAMILALAFGWSAIAGLTVLYGSIALGDLVGNAVRFASYRVGA
jgi:hypothetical protein